MLERRLYNKMSTEDKNNIRAFPTLTPNPNKFSLKNFLYDYGVILTILSSALILYLSIHDFQKDVDYLTKNMATQESVDNIDEQYDDLNQKIDNQYNDITNELDELDDNYRILDKDLNTMKAINDLYKGMATSAFQNRAFSFTQKDGVYSVEKDGTYSAINALWNDSEILCNNDEENFNTNELINKKLLLSYLQNNQEIYFYGQYSTNKRWDGNCIINIYEDNKLQLVTDALYNDGQLESYQQVFTYNTTASEEVWCISKRKCIDKGNMGDSWNYYKNSDIEKDFTMQAVEPDNILNVAQVRKIVKEDLNCPIEAFYHGNTSNGLYNDDTGESYMVKFAKADGTVRTLYFGRFKNGKMCDETGQAWMIGRDISKIDSTYSFYIGKFNDNKASELWTDDNSKSALSEDDIKKKIKSKSIKPVITWHGFEDIL